MPRLLAVACVVASASAVAADQLSFRSPSGNIECVMSDFGFEQSAECHIHDATPSFSTPPEECDLDWGNRFFVLDKGRGQRSCWSDAYFQPDGPVLPYGASITYKGVTCASEPTGVTCTNADGGGFSVRRAEQKVF